MSGIRVNIEKCNGCRICESICSFGKHEEFNPKRASIRVVKAERMFLDVPMVCRQCQKPACVAACLTGALRREGGRLAPVDERLCTGCEDCVQACPFGTIFLDAVTGAAVACDLCGGHPRCVEWCPVGALSWEDVEASAQSRRWYSAVSASKKVLKKWGVDPGDCEAFYDVPTKEPREASGAARLGN